MKLNDVEQNYDSAASHYDLFTDAIFHRLLGLYRWRRALIDGLGDVRGATVLDVGCGTGNNFPLLISKIGTEGRIIGVDYSSGMLAEARKRVEAAGWTNVELLKDDAAQLRSVPGPVDATISAWCLGIVEDLPSALQRLVELTKPGGRIGVLDFRRARPDHGLLRWLYPIYRRILISTGIDAPEDLDDARLSARWDKGMAYLESHLRDLENEQYLSGGGFLLQGERIC